MKQTRIPIRPLLFCAAVSVTGACANDPALLDWDLRPDGAGAFSTADAARSATASRPMPDANGVISYPGYQVAVARQGDSVASVATRVGIPPAELASYNALNPDAPLNAGEVLALPRRVSSPAPGATGTASAASLGAPIQSGTIEVTPLSAATGGAQATGTQPAKAGVLPGGVEPVRHRVQRGETAYTIARLYNVPVKSIAEWNGLGPDLSVREGQYLLIPVPLGTESKPPAEPVAMMPGEGSPTPPPPSASKPLPDEKLTPAAKPAPETPPSPELKNDRTAASAARFAMPADGAIVRGFDEKKNPGIDIEAAAGSTVRAAADGTVAAITKDTNQIPVLIIRHTDNILTVYGNVDGIKVAKGDTVKRGGPIAAVRAGDPSQLHFEVRNGIDAVDPMPYLE